MKFSALYFVAAMAGLAFSAPAASPEDKEVIDPTQGNSYKYIEPVFTGEIPGTSPAPAKTLERRNGYHYAQYWTSSGCTGTVVAFYENFGCGGCRNFPRALSLYIYQAGTSNPRPSGTNFYAGGCNGGGGATNFGLQNTSGACYNFNNWVSSSYLYWNC